MYNFPITFAPLIGLNVGITSTTIDPAPYYVLEICVSVTSGVLQSGVMVNVSLTVAKQGQG